MNGFKIHPKTIIGYRKNGKPIYLAAGGSEPLYDGGGTEQQGTGGNPAWQEFYNVVPQELHEQVTPLLEKWDKGVNERFEKVHSDYAGWKQFREAKIEPNQVQYALNIVNALEENPKVFYDSLAAYYKDDPRFGAPGQGLEEPKEGQEDTPEWKKEFDTLRKQNEVLSQSLINQQREQQKRDADAWLENTMGDLRKKHGAFDENYVLAMMMQLKVEPEKAVEMWQKKENELVGKYKPKPLVMGSGGGMPGQNADPKKMDEAGRKNLVVQLLNAQQQNQ